MPHAIRPSRNATSITDDHREQRERAPQREAPRPAGGRLAPSHASLTALKQRRGRRNVARQLTSDAEPGRDPERRLDVRRVTRRLELRAGRSRATPISSTDEDRASGGSAR